VRFTDLHCHLLPGVDDGPDTLEESVAYAAAASEAGTGTIVATPHVEVVDVRELPGRVAELRDALDGAEVDLHVEVGGELKPESLGLLSQAELEIIAHGPPDARWLLYEVPFDGVDEAFLAGARELGARGFGLLLAHPERSRAILPGGLHAVERLLDEGALVAANVGPLLGREGRERLATAEHLLRRGVPAALATDAHPPVRPYTLAMGAEAITAATGRAEVAHRMTANLPARLLREGLPAAGERAA
jgi:protein-tyrosine phosphatase